MKKVVLVLLLLVLVIQILFLDFDDIFNIALNKKAYIGTLVTLLAIIAYYFEKK